MLEESVALSRENRQILKSMQRARRWQTFFWFVKWLVILGVTLGAYYYFQPFINKLLDTYQKMPSLDLSGINKLIEGSKNTPAPR